MRPFAHKEFHAAGVEVGHVVLRRRAALNKVQVCPGLHDDQRVLELARASGIQAEVALEREAHLDPGRHIDKGAAGPYRAMECGKLVVCRRDQLHEVLADRLFVGAVEGLLDTRVDHPQLCHLFAHVVVDQLGVILGAHTGQAGALGLGNAQALEGVLDVLRHLVPGVCLFGAAGHISGDVRHVQPGDGGSPIGGHRSALINLQGAQAQVEHPLGLVLLAADLLHDLRRKAIRETLVALFALHKVVEAAIHIGNLGPRALRPLRQPGICLSDVCHGL